MAKVMNDSDFLKCENKYLIRFIEIKRSLVFFCLVLGDLTEKELIESMLIKVIF